MFASFIIKAKIKTAARVNIRDLPVAFPTSPKSDDLPELVCSIKKILHIDTI
jgi:hypothetical protein